MAERSLQKSDKNKDWPAQCAWDLVVVTITSFFSFFCVVIFIRDWKQL